MKTNNHPLNAQAEPEKISRERRNSESHAGFYEPTDLHRVILWVSIFSAYLLITAVLAGILRLSNLTENLLRFIPYSIFLLGILYSSRAQIKFDKKTLLLALFLFCFFIRFLFDLTRTLPWLDDNPIFGRGSQLRFEIANIALILGIFSFLTGSYFAAAELYRTRLKLAEENEKLRRLELMLRDEAEFRRSIIDTAAEGICVFQVLPEFPFLRFSVWNDQMILITGFSMEEINRRGWTETLIREPRLCEKFTHWTAEVLQDKYQRGEEWPITRADGERRFLSIICSRLLDGRNQMQVLALMQDITDRKRAESVLREDKEKMQRIVGDMPILLDAFDAQSRIIFWNVECEKVTGYTKEEIVENPKALELLYPNDKYRRFVFDSVQKEFGDFKNLEFELTCKNGEKRIISWSNISREIPIAGWDTWAVGTDITDRKRIEEALRLSQERFQQVAENAQEWIWEVDVDGLYTYSSPAVEKILGYKSEEIVGKKYFYDLFLPENREAQQKAALEMFAQKKSFQEFLNCNIHKDGQVVYFLTSGVPILDEDGNLTGYRGVDIDITAQKQTEMALQASEQYFRQLVEYSPVAMVVLTVKDEIFLMSNPKCTELFGYTMEEVHDLSRWWRLAYPDENYREIIRTEWTNRVAAAVQNHISIEPIETQVTCKDGTIRYIESHAVLIGDRILISLIDLTERKKLQEQLIQSQKMEAIGRLAGGVAHDFNNLLTVITGYTSLILKKLRAADPYRRGIEEIQKAGKRAASLTHQLLAYSRKQILQPQVLNLNQLILNLDKMLRRLMGEDIELVILPAQDLGLVNADLSQIEQIIMNLAVNARDAMPKGGRFTIETKNCNLEESFPQLSDDFPPGSYILLSVSDNGCGMDSETMKQIFDPFFTTKEQGKGTGLGLATVYGIVKQSRGHITVESGIAQGTTFRIYLPRIEEIPVHGEIDSSKLEWLKGTETILLVEDEEMVRSMVTDTLQNSGYTVLTAAYGAEALKISETYPETIQLLITDIVMPRMSGREVAEQLTAVRTDMKVLFMSGYTDDAIIHHGIFEERVAFIQKPFPIDQLLQKIRELLDHPKDLGREKESDLK